MPHGRTGPARYEHRGASPLPLAFPPHYGGSLLLSPFAVFSVILLQCQFIHFSPIRELKSKKQETPPDCKWTHSFKGERCWSNCSRMQKEMRLECRRREQWSKKKRKAPQSDQLSFGAISENRIVGVSFSSHPTPSAVPSTVDYLVINVLHLLELVISTFSDPGTTSNPNMHLASHFVTFYHMVVVLLL